MIINKLCYSTTRLLNEFSAILARKDLVDSATQTDFEVHNNVEVNIADATNAADNQCTYTLSGLSTEIEGLKLNIIITESNILSKVQSNNQAIEQIRHDLDSIKSQQSKSNFTSDNNIAPVTNSGSINVGPIANSTKIDSTARGGSRGSQISHATNVKRRHIKKFGLRFMNFFPAQALLFISDHAIKTLSHSSI